MIELSPLIEEVLQAGGQVELTVTGRSMRPMLWDRRSKVRLSKPDCLSRGDIILYRRMTGQYVLHRITWRTAKGYICCGDAQWILEKDIGADQVIGKMYAFTLGQRWVKCNNFLYRIYWQTWLTLRPLRKLAIGIRHCLRSIRRRNRREP